MAAGVSSATTTKIIIPYYRGIPGSRPKKTGY